MRRKLIIALIIPMKIIQLTDLHLYADPIKGKLLGMNTAESFQAVLSLLKTPPDMILLTGDLSQDETRAAYQYIIQSLKNFTCPIYWIPGNHDNPALMAEVFLQYADIINIYAYKSILIDNWHLILLDTHYAQHVEGLLSEESLNQLDALLTTYADKNTLIFMHHPPVSINCAWIDKLALVNTQAFGEIIDKHTHIKAIFCGHVHQEYKAFYKKIPVYTSPSTCIQFKPETSEFTLDTLKPGYRWIELSTTDAHFQTSIERAEEFEYLIDPYSKGY